MFYVSRPGIPGVPLPAQTITQAISLARASGYFCTIHDDSTRDVVASYNPMTLETIIFDGRAAS
jgi:hypothetical protein